MAALLLAGAGAVLLLGLPVRAAAEPALWFLGLSGAIGAAVMVLPGVSGAFVLLVLGPYPYLIDLIRDLTRGAPQLLPLLVFQAGVLLGLGTVSKLLTWLLRRARGVTLAALSGLMLGSLRRLWPFLALPPGADCRLPAAARGAQGAAGGIGTAARRRTCRGAAGGAGRRGAGRGRGGLRPALRGPFIGRPRPLSLMHRLACLVCAGRPATALLLQAGWAAPTGVGVCPSASRAIEVRFALGRGAGVA